MIQPSLGDDTSPRNDLMKKNATLTRYRRRLVLLVRLEEKIYTYKWLVVGYVGRTIMLHDQIIFLLEFNCQCQ